jgi:excisionase family DNA binding protein
MPAHKSTSPAADGGEQLALLELERAPLRDATYVAGLLGIPRKSVLQYAREGRLPSVRIGRHVRFVIADVQAAIDAQRPTPSR